MLIYNMQTYIRDNTFYSCNFNLRDKEGSTALHIAVMVNNIYLIRLLISKGIDTSIEDNAGRTAEQLAYELVNSYYVHVFTCMDGTLARYLYNAILS